MLNDDQCLLAFSDVSCFHDIKRFQNENDKKKCDQIQHDSRWIVYYFRDLTWLIICIPRPI
jgi:hypothetical protein